MFYTIKRNYLNTKDAAVVEKALEKGLITEEEKENILLA